LLCSWFIQTDYILRLLAFSQTYSAINCKLHTSSIYLYPVHLYYQNSLLYVHIMIIIPRSYQKQKTKQIKHAFFFHIVNSNEMSLKVYTFSRSIVDTDVIYCEVYLSWLIFFVIADVKMSFLAGIVFIGAQL
jgi:hypothetical protein